MEDSKLFESNSTQKKIRVFRNGDHTIKADLVLKPSITFQQLKVDILRKLGLRDTGVFRLFTSEGLELYDDYIPLIKDQESLFVSLGEGFDQTTTLREYVEMETIGEGGFGKVVLVQHKVTKKKYAIKYVDARHYGLASLIDMVFSEAELLKNLKHKNIVEITSFFKLRDLRVVFMMEYLEGGELGAYLKSKGKLNEEEARELFKQLLDAVHFCHMNKIIHRDLKPENILFVSKNSKQIKVVDFGIAGLYSGFNFDVSDAGSLRYMAPEILSGKNKAANPAMDVWSMGCILYTLFHGQPPFSGSNRDVKDAILKGEYKFDPQVKSKLSPECVDLIEKMLIVDYSQRISTFGIKEHPWMTGEKNVLKIQSLPTQEEAKELKLANTNLQTEMPPISQKKQVVALKNLRDKGASHSFNLKSKNSAPESKAAAENVFKMPGQNTLRRAISKEARRKSEAQAATERPLKKLDQKSSFADPKNKEKSEVKKGLPLLGRKLSRGIEEAEGNLKGPEKV